MKRLIFIPLLLLTISLRGTIYYCSPDGNDSSDDPTNIATPWRTWHYAFNHTTPGDTCYFRGGVYQPYSSSMGADLKTTAVDGTHSHPTCFFAYPADFAARNYPILDCQTMTSSYNIGVEISRCSNIYFKGLMVRNVTQTVPGVANAKGWYIWSEGSMNQYGPKNLKFENCVAHNISGCGFAISVVDTINMINCDAFNIIDTLNATDAGGQGTGFQYTIRKSTWDYAEYSYAYFYGCRAWSCSDQGFSLGSEGKTVSDHCWAINNGNTPFSVEYDGVTYTNKKTKGSGWKLWFVNSNYRNSNETQTTIHNCIAAYNAHIGINWTDINNEGTHPEIRAHIYNNFIYANTYLIEFRTTAWGYGVSDAANVDTVGAWDHWWRNNVSYYNVERRDFIAGIRSGSSNNYFDVTGTPVNATWFQSLDTTGMMGIHEREADWSLPETDFGKLSETSPLINAGIDVGLPYNDSAPDIGWAEFTVPAPPTPPLVATLSPYNVNIQHGTGMGIVTYDGDFTVSERGICWSTSADPEITDNYVSCGAGVEGATFTATMTGLSPKTTYHVRAYASNGLPAYGADVEFTTPDWGVGWHEGKAVFYNGKVVIIK